MKKLNYEDWQRKYSIEVGIIRKKEIECTQLVVDRALKAISEQINELIDEVEKLTDKKEV